MPHTDLTGARRHAQFEGYDQPKVGLGDVDPIVTTSYLVVLESVLIRLAKEAAESQD